MFKTVRTIALSTMLGLGAIAGASAVTTTSAEAASLSFGGKHGHVEVRFGHGRHHGGWHKGGRRSFCSPHRAVRKARRIGLHRAHVRFANRRVVAVSGRMWGHHRTLVFANTRHCPRIR
ncbi:MAG: hypothetical protein R3D65_12555 [Zhengella sp.]|uniref:hypothetical protein n=1 Tax=Zhengella sp. TaxID=2282762 RepID=UPI001E0C8A47|nr:hypothetical protein [Notoacmeibacter sp.]MCC0028622.1 hypothetical protein [Brucellaceae bacterium]